MGQIPDLTNCVNAYVIIEGLTVVELIGFPRSSDSSCRSFSFALSFISSKLFNPFFGTPSIFKMLSISEKSSISLIFSSAMSVFCLFSRLSNSVEASPNREIIIYWNIRGEKKAIVLSTYTLLPGSANEETGKVKLILNHLLKSLTGISGIMLR